jgi:hypothetical protein
MSYRYEIKFAGSSCISLMLPTFDFFKAVGLNTRNSFKYYFWMEQNLF